MSIKRIIELMFGVGPGRIPALRRNYESEKNIAQTKKKLTEEQKAAMKKIKKTLKELDGVMRDYEKAKAEGNDH